MRIDRLSPDALADRMIANGGHPDRSDGLCAMELVAWMAGEPHSDSPDCTSPVLAVFVRTWNDAISDDATRTRLLKPILPRLIGTRGSAAVEQRRADLAFDWCVRVSTPAWLDAAKLTGEAAALRALPPLLSTEAVLAATAAIKAASSKAAAAWDAARAAAWAAARDAAWTAAWAAARDAAWAAAWAAARDAAWTAAWDAARDAAWDAAWAAARAAAWDALQPTVDQLQISALDLLERMIAVTDADVAA